MSYKSIEIDDNFILVTLENGTMVLLAPFDGATVETVVTKLNLTPK